jgi:hypothetical protein
LLRWFECVAEVSASLPISIGCQSKTRNGSEDRTANEKSRKLLWVIGRGSIFSIRCSIRSLMRVSDFSTDEHSGVDHAFLHNRLRFRLFKLFVDVHSW